MQDWLDQHADITALRLAVADLNGQARGKRLPRQFSGKVFDGGTRLPFSTLNVDLLGQDIDDSPLVFDSGDADGLLVPTERGFIPMPWLDTPTAMLPMGMFHPDNTAFDGDPRHALHRVLERYTLHHLTPVSAIEMEFYLIDTSGPPPQIPCVPGTAYRHAVPDTLSISALDDFDGFLTDLYAACKAMDIPADAAISESGVGQFEINLLHCDDALRTADNAWLFKIAAKGVARKHGFTASFMAKPYPDSAGSGMHSHFSVLDAEGQNIFDDGSPNGSETLRHAVAGCLAAMADSSLIFAPFDNSFERLVPGAHAPTSLCWGYDNRTTALRIPAGPPKARRIEHRVAGADTNPYLMLAAILGAALNGIEDKTPAPPAITGNAYGHTAPQIAQTLEQAITNFEHSDHIKRLFPALMIDNFSRTKHQENRILTNLDSKTRSAIYLKAL